MAEATATLAYMLFEDFPPARVADAESWRRWCEKNPEKCKKKSQNRGHYPAAIDKAPPKISSQEEFS